MDECDSAFSKLKEFLASPLILTCPIVGSHLYLYLSIIDLALSSILVKETYNVEKFVYFVSKVLKGVEARYQKIERFMLAVVVTSRKLKPYFQ